MPSVLATGLDDDQQRIANALAGMAAPPQDQLVTPRNPNAPPAWATNLVQGLGNQLSMLAATPAQVSETIPPERPGYLSEEDVLRQDAVRQREAQFGPEMAQMMLGVGGARAAVAGANELGAAGGRMFVRPDAARDALMAGSGRAIPAATPSAAEAAAQTVRDARISPPPSSGSMNPLDNVPVMFRGKSPMEMTPEEYQAFGAHYGVKNLGPLSPLQNARDAAGREFSIPGGAEGKWTYYDLLHMKANPINL